MTHLLPTVLVGVGAIGASVVRYTAREIDAIDPRAGALAPSLIVGWKPGDEIVRDEPVETWPDGARRFHFHASDGEAAEFDYPLDPEATVRIPGGRRFEERCDALGKVLRDQMSIALDYGAWRNWIKETGEPDHLAVAQRESRVVVVADVTEPRARQMLCQVLRHCDSTLVPAPVLLQLVVVGVSRAEVDPAEAERGEVFCTSLMAPATGASPAARMTLWRVDDTTSTGSRVEAADLVDWLQQAVVLAVAPSVGEEIRAQVFPSPRRASIEPQAWAIGGWFGGFSLSEAAARVLVVTGESFAKSLASEIASEERQTVLTAESEFLGAVGAEGSARAVAFAAGLSLKVIGTSTEGVAATADPVALEVRLPEPPALRDVAALPLDAWDDALDRAEVAYGFSAVGTVIDRVRSAASSYSEMVTDPAGPKALAREGTSPEPLSHFVDRYILAAGAGCLEKVKCVLAEASRLALADVRAVSAEAVSLVSYRDAIRRRLDRQPHVVAYTWRAAVVSLLFGYVAWRLASGLGPVRQSLWGAGAGILAFVAGLSALSLKGRKLLAALARYRGALADCARAAVQTSFERDVTETVERIRGAIEAELDRIRVFERILEEQASHYRAFLTAEGACDTVLVKRATCREEMRTRVDSDADVSTRLRRRLVDGRFLQPWREMDAEDLRRGLWARLVDAAREEDVPKPNPADVIPPELLRDARKASEEVPLLCRVRDHLDLRAHTVTHLIARGMDDCDHDAAMTTWCGMVGALAKARAEVREP